MRVVAFIGYCAAVSLVATLWLSAESRTYGSTFLAGLVIFVLSLPLGRLLPFVGFVAPVPVALGWLVILYAKVEAPAVVDQENPRALWALFLFCAVLVAEAGVAAGALSAAFSSTSRDD